MYEKGDLVHVWDDGELLDDMYVITRNRDDRYFDVAKTDDLECELKMVERDCIMFDWEVDKIVILSLKRELQTVDGCDDSEIYNATYSDKTIEGLAMFFNGYEDVIDFYRWFDNGQFGYYGKSMVWYAKDTDMYHVWVESYV